MKSNKRIFNKRMVHQCGMDSQNDSTVFVNLLRYQDKRACSALSFYSYLLEEEEDS